MGVLFVLLLFGMIFAAPTHSEVSVMGYCVKKCNAWIVDFVCLSKNPRIAQYCGNALIQFGIYEPQTMCIPPNRFYEPVEKR